MCTIVSYINTERVYIFMYITCIMGVWAGHSVHNFTMPLYSFKLVSISSVCHSKKIYFQVLPTCSNIPTFMGRTRLALSWYILKGCPYSIFFYALHQSFTKMPIAISLMPQEPCNIPWSTNNAEFSSTHLEITTFYYVSGVFLTKTLRRQKLVHGLESFHSNMYLNLFVHHTIHAIQTFSLLTAHAKFKHILNGQATPLAPPLFFYL